MGKQYIHKHKHESTKHINTQYYYIHESYAEQVLNFAYVPNEQQEANILHLHLYLYVWPAPPSVALSCCFRPRGRLELHRRFTHMIVVAAQYSIYARGSLYMRSVVLRRAKFVRDYSLRAGHIKSSVIKLQGFSLHN